MASAAVQGDVGGSGAGPGASVSLNTQSVEFTTINLEGDGRAMEQKPGAATAAGPPPGAATPTLDFSLDESVTNQLLPATSFTTTSADGAVNVHLERDGAASMPPISVPYAFKQTVMRLPMGSALAVERNGQWLRWTYKQYYHDVVRAAKSFIKLGLEPYKGVGVLGFNTPEWFFSFLGAIYAGGIGVGIYTTNSPDACHHVLSDSHSQIVVVEDDIQLQKILKIRDRLPEVKAIIQFMGTPKEPYDRVYSWSDFMSLGQGVPDAAVQGRLTGIHPNQCCSLIYTSGTTGSPKGVMTSHDNYTFTGHMLAKQTQFEFGREIIVSYLPLSHSAAQFYDLMCGLVNGMSVFFARPDALKGTLGLTLKEVRPTVFGGVPRVWEKIMEKMQETAKSVTGLKRKIGIWAKGVGLQGAYAKINGTPMPKFWGLANKLVFSKVKAQLGLDRCKILVSGAAPISRQTLLYFMSLDLVMYEQYGMSETSGPHTVCTVGSSRLGSVGRPIDGVQARIDHPDEKGHGEIMMYGRNLMMGYLGREEQTAETIESSGWIHSGDIGMKDEQGFYFITGRIKELLITAGGENIPPVIIEDMVKAELPFVSNCMLIGDKRKFLSMLVTLKTLVDADTMMPQDRLSPAAIDWCRQHGSPSSTVTQVLSSRDEVVLRAIQQGIDTVNKRATSNAQKIQKWSLIPRDFSLPTGELGPTLKLKRPVVLDRYKKTIFAFYGE